jgi:hypothetical protein
LPLALCPLPPPHALCPMPSAPGPLRSAPYASTLHLVFEPLKTYRLLCFSLYKDASSCYYFMNTDKLGLTIIYIELNIG